MGFTVDPFTCELLASGFQGGSGASRRADRGRKSIRRLCKWPYLLGGSWAVLSWVISPLIWVITLVILLITLLITTHEPPSMMRSAQLFVISFGAFTRVSRWVCKWFRSIQYWLKMYRCHVVQGPWCLWGPWPGLAASFIGFAGLGMSGHKVWGIGAWVCEARGLGHLGLTRVHFFCLHCWNSARPCIPRPETRNLETP